MLATFVITGITIVICVLIHFECLDWMAKNFNRWNFQHRHGIALMLLGAMMAHVLEIWCFAFAYYFLFLFSGVGYLEGMEGLDVDVSSLDLLDYSYFSFVCFTTLGFGDIVPEGYVRFLVGSEALTGLVLITWTASFLFMQMERYWRN